MRAIPESGVADVHEIDKSVCDRPEVRVQLILCATYTLENMASARNLDLTKANEFGGYLGVCIINPRRACAARDTVVVLCVSRPRICYSRNYKTK